MYFRVLLCEEIILPIFGMQLKLSFTVLWLNIFDILLSLGKHWSRILKKNFFPKFVFKLLQKGGLYQVTFLCLVLFLRLSAGGFVGLKCSL